MRLPPKSRRGQAAGAAGLAALLALGWCDWYRPWEAAHYRGRPTSWWAAEARRWESMLVYSSVTQGNAIYYRPPSAPAAWLAWLTGSPDRAAPDTDLPLLKGDPAAVPVLTDLLRHPEGKLRLAAVMGLWLAGPAGRPAVPTLLASLEDQCFEVRSAALAALDRIDPAALAAHVHDRPGAAAAAEERRP